MTPPADVVALAGPPQQWTAISTDSSTVHRAVAGDSHVWSAADRVVKRSVAGAGRAEAERLEWLVGRVRVPEVQLLSCVAGHDWLVLERLHGHCSDRIDLHGDIHGIVGVIADALHRVHRSAVGRDDFPFAVGWEAYAAEVEQAASTLDPTTLPDPYRRYSASDLLGFFLDGRPAKEDLVLCHGKPVLENLVVEGTNAGWVDLGRLRLADRHVDLAIVQQSLHRRFGPESVFAFYEAFGAEADMVRLDHYLLGALILS